MRLPPASFARHCAGILLALSVSASAGTLIVGGQTSSQWPAVGEVIATTDFGYSTCTGTAITPRWVLTAAHCVSPATVGAGAVFQFLLGPNDTSPSAVLYAVDDAFYDPVFDPGQILNGHDVGLLHIQDVDLPVLPFKLNSKTLTTDIVGGSVVVMGYGLTSGGGFDTGIKRIAQIRIDSLNTELVSTTQSSPITCEGDSGGPVFVYDADGFPLVIATTSFGMFGCTGGASFYRTDAALPFITATVGAGLCLDGQVCDGIRRNDFEADLALADGCYVRAGATGAHSGASWGDAYDDPQSAFGNAACKHIRIAAGIYKPATTTDRTATFVIPAGARVYGGFAGIRTARDPMLYTTVLSGDVDNNDINVNGVVTDWSNIVGANSYHVVTMDGTTTALGYDTQLDGLTITAGDANGTVPNDRGGALYCKGAGAGHACSPTLSDLVFAGNYAANFGGALYADATNAGNSSPLIGASTFTGNYADNGGGAYHDTGLSGGGTSSPAYANDTFTTNGATYGGALYHHVQSGTGTLLVTNSTFSGNVSAFGGGAIAEYSVGGAPAIHVVNSILWGDVETGATGNEELIIVADTPTFANSIVMGSGGSGAGWVPAFGTDGGGNLDSDPMLGPLQNNGGATRTLLPSVGSSAIDNGSDAACTAAPVSGLDQRGVVRPQGSHCDIGAVEAEP